VISIVRAGLLALLGVALDSAPRGGVVINEVRYDPPGADAGGEYVELLNPGPAEVVLGPDWRLERGNGSAPGQWTSFWVGDGTVLQTGERLAVGDDPRAARPSTPALQNGPDACRLVRDVEVVDLVGWGELAYPEYFEGRPAEDPALGLIARKPDGLDRDANADDFVATVLETPGEPNFRRFALLVESLDPPLDPLLPLPGEPFRVRFVVRSEGLESIGAGMGGVLERMTGRAWRLETELPPGARRDGEIELPGRGGGVHIAVLDAWVDGEEALEDAAVRFRVGSGPVVLSEIQARPREGEPEWIEVVARAGEAVDLTGWSIVDAAGGRGLIAGSSLLEGDPLVLTESRDRFLGVHPQLTPERVLGVAGWPTLNDTGETLALVAADSVLSDAVAFDAAGAEPGQSLERVHPEIPSQDPAAWVLAPRGATPGGRNGAHAEPLEREGLQVIPEVVGGDGAEIRFHLGPGAGTLRLDLYDAAERHRGVILERHDAAGRGGIHWDGRVEGRDLGPGLYFLVLRFTTTGGAERTERCAVAIGW
jgi:hypothetical protein